MGKIVAFTYLWNTIRLRFSEYFFSLRFSNFVLQNFKKHVGILAALRIFWFVCVAKNLCDALHSKGLFIWDELARLRGLARLGEVIFIPRSYGMFYLTVKSLLRHCKKIVLITWLLSGKFYISIWIPEGCNNFTLLYTVLWIWPLLFLFLCNLMGFYLY